MPLWTGLTRGLQESMERVRRERWGCRGPEQEVSFCRACSVPWAKLVSFGFGEGRKLIMFSVPQSYIFHIFYQVQLALLQATNKCIIKSSIYDTLKSESEVAQSSPTLCDPMDCSLPRLLSPWNFPGKSTEVGCHFLLQGIFPTRDQTLVSRVAGRRFTV